MIPLFCIGFSTRQKTLKLAYKLLLLALTMAFKSFSDFNKLFASKTLSSTESGYMYTLFLCIDEPDADKAIKLLQPLKTAVKNIDSTKIANMIADINADCMLSILFNCSAEEAERLLLPVRQAVAQLPQNLIKLKAENAGFGENKTYWVKPKKGDPDFFNW